MKRLPVLLLLLALLVACSEIPAPTATFVYTGPTTAPTEPPFAGPPTEPPPDIFDGIGQNDPTAAALPSSAGLPPLLLGSSGDGGQRVDVTAVDGALLLGDLYQIAEVRQPGVLLLATDRTSWGDFPARLHASGFTVLSMEMRPGGGVDDVRVMLEALTSGTADPAHIGVIGAGAGADLALTGCAALPICDTVALLSPLEPALLAQVGAWNPRPILQLVSQEDEESFTVAQAIDAAATGEKAIQPLVSAGRGTAILLNRPDMGDVIIGWMQRQLSG